MANNTGDETAEENVKTGDEAVEAVTENNVVDFEADGSIEEESAEEEKPSELDEARAEAETLKKENSELKDQYLRKHADF